MQRLAGVVGLFVALLLLTGSLPQLGKPDKKKEAKIRKFLEVSGLRKSYEESLKKMPLDFVREFGQESRQTLKKLVTKKDVEKLMAKVVQGVDRNFSVKEIDELIEFYETPLGKKLAKNVPIIAANTDSSMKKWEEKLRVRALETLRKKGLARGHSTGMETSVIGALRTISSVQAQFREGDRDNDNTLDYAQTLVELEQAGLIDKALGSGIKSGYIFKLSGDTFDWECTAEPEDTRLGLRNFIVCTDGVVRFANEGTWATCSSPAIQ